MMKTLSHSALLVLALFAVAGARAQNAPPPAANVPLVETVDVSTTTPAIQSFGRKGFLTAIMLTSAACPACKKARPWMESLPRRKANSRTVFADVGVTERGGINFQAPIVAALKLDHLPYFYLLDEAGAVGAQGEAAEEILKKILK